MRWTRGSWVVVTIILLLYLLLVPEFFRLRTWPFDSDEAMHAIDGLHFVIDLRKGQLGQGLKELYFHPWYPPGLSLYLTPFILVFGPENWAARYPLLLLFLLGVALLYKVSKLLWADEWAAVGSAMLGATSPLLWMMSVQCMEESLALIGVLATIAAYAQVVKRGQGWLRVGCAIALTFLLKIPSAVFLSSAVILTLMTHWKKWQEKLFLLKALGPIVLTTMLWWGHPYKIQGGKDYFLASAPGFSAFTPDTLLHYWEQMLKAYTLGWGIGIIAILGIALSTFHWVRRKDPLTGFPLLLVLSTWAILVLKRQTGTRFFYTALPPAFLLASHQVAVTWRFLSQVPRRALKIGGVSMLGIYLMTILVIRVLALPLLMESSYETDLVLVEVAEWIAARTSSNKERIFLINDWDQFSASALEWSLWRSHWGEEEKTVEIIQVALQDPEECPACVEAFGREVLKEPQAHIVHLENTPVPAAGAWWAYRATLAPCWDGEWETTTTFWVPLWPKELSHEIMAHPEGFVNRAEWEAIRQSRYFLSVGVRTVAWEECSGQ